MTANQVKPGPSYRWYLVGLLWFCGFFNYADRQAVNAVFPQIQAEFRLTDAQLGMLGSAFMVVYAASAPLAGFVVDRAPRRILIASGLAFWSLVCAATGLSRSFGQLLAFRAAEGLGESFYFPASMTLLADYHPPATRSRAMSLHQTSVYIGSAGGVALAGLLAERYGWRSPFWILGLIGTAFAFWVATQVVEPARGASEVEPTDEPPAAKGSLAANLAEIVANPAALALLGVFAGANFVASVFLTWLPTFLAREFSLGPAWSSLASTAWPLASLVGALLGGALADRASSRPGGRVRVQAAGLLLGAPLVLATALAGSLPAAVVASLGLGLCKGVYDANIFASLYDAVRPGVRGTAAGLMNTVGWTGGAVAPFAVGLASERYGLGPAVASSSAVYVAAGLLALRAAALAARRGTGVAGSGGRV